MSSTALTADPRYYGENWRYAALAKIILANADLRNADLSGGVYLALNDETVAWALLATLDTENTP